MQGVQLNRRKTNLVDGLIVVMLLWRHSFFFMRIYLIHDRNARRLQSKKIRVVVSTFLPKFDGVIW